MFLEHEFYFDLFLKAIETEFMTDSCKIKTI